MRLSLRTLELCRIKFGKGTFCGFQAIDETVLDGISEGIAEQDFDELIRNGVIHFHNDNIQITPLGQHIFRMMLKPEQYIMVNCAANHVCVRIYIRDAYFLCVVENKTITSLEEYDRYTLKLLPRLELVVGALAYALQCNRVNIPIEDDNNQQVDPDILVTGKAWRQEQEIVSELTICGKYHNGNIRYQMADNDKDLDELECEPSELLNTVTKWMLENISIIYSEVN